MKNELIIRSSMKHIDTYFDISQAERMVKYASPYTGCA